MPSRLHDAPDPVSRRPIVRVVETADSVESKRATNSSLKSVVSNLKRMVLGQWKYEEQNSFVKLHLFDNEHVLPKFQVIIYSSLKFRVSIFGWDLIKSHPFYTENEQSVKFFSLRDLINKLESYTFCAGVPKPNCVAKTVEDPSGPQTSGKNIIVRHTIPVIKDADEDTDTTAGDVQPLPFKVCTYIFPNRKM